MVDYSLTITRLSTADVSFEQKLGTLLEREMLLAPEVTNTVSEILDAVRSRGDEAVMEYTNRFDGFSANSIADLLVTQEQMAESLDRTPAKQRHALSHAAEPVSYTHLTQPTIYSV